MLLWWQLQQRQLCDHRFLRTKQGQLRKQLQRKLVLEVSGAYIQYNIHVPFSRSVLYFTKASVVRLYLKLGL